MFVSQYNNYDFKFTREYAEIFYVLIEEVQSQNFLGCESISIEVVAPEKF